MAQSHHKIIVATDFSESSRRGLQYAVWFGQRFDSEVILLYVAEHVGGFTGISPEQAKGHRSGAEKRMDEWMASHGQGGEGGKGVNWSKMYREGKPWKEIVAAANEISADMIFMGTMGINTMGEIFLGSNAGKVARSANCPVVTVHPNGKPMSPVNHILIPVDPNFGMKELRNYFAQHPSWRPSVTLITVAPHDAHHLNKEEEHLKKQVDALHKIGFTEVDLHILKSDVVSSAILGYVDKHREKIDMVLMETKGRKGLSGWFIGSVTEEVISFSPIPVLSLRPDRKEFVSEYYSSNLPV